MKRKLAVILCFVMLMAVVPVSASEIGQDQPQGVVTDVEYFDDGSYVVTTIEDENSGISLFSQTTVTKSKTGTYYNSSGTAIYALKVTGTFRYGDGSSTCTSASASTTIYGKTWALLSKTTATSGGTAIAKFNMQQSVNGTPVKTLITTLTLSCSATGVFS